MKSFVITMMNLQESVDLANRCISSFKNIAPIMFEAITPRNSEIYKICSDKKINTSEFSDDWSRKENAISCFLSHYSLWEKCANQNEVFMILEHDSVCVKEIDFSFDFKSLINIGKPSFGRFNIPRNNGVNPLTSKAFMPGAHAYMIKPHAAKELLKHAKVASKPTDVFLDVRVFSWIEEYYPWPIEAHDTFSTVQQTKGCIAKHAYSADFRLL